MFLGYWSMAKKDNQDKSQFFLLNEWLCTLLEMKTELQQMIFCDNQEHIENSLTFSHAYWDV